MYNDMTLENRRYSINFCDERRFQIRLFNTFEDIFDYIKLCKRDSRITVFDKEENKNVTADFRKYAEETENFTFFDEIDSKLSAEVKLNFPTYQEEYYYEYLDGNFLRVQSLIAIHYEEYGRNLWKKDLCAVGFFDKLKDKKGVYKVIYIDRKSDDSPIYASSMDFYAKNDDTTREELLNPKNIICNNFETFWSRVKQITNDDEYMEKIADEDEEKIVVSDEEIRGEKIDYRIENVEYKGETFEILKFTYKNVNFAYSIFDLGEKISEEDDIGSDFEKSITAFIEDDDFEAMKEELDENPYWNNFVEFSDGRYIQNFTIFYDWEKFGFDYNDEYYETIKLKFDDSEFGYVLNDESISVEELTKIAKKHNCSELISKDKYDKLKEYAKSKNDFLIQEFAQFCKENEIPNIFDGYEMERGYNNFSIGL